MKALRYATVVVSFLVGWIGVAVLVSRWMAEIFPGDYGDTYRQYGYPSERHALTDWLESPGSVLGLPAGVFLAYASFWILKRADDAR